MSHTKIRWPLDTTSEITKNTDSTETEHLKILARKQSSTYVCYDITCTTEITETFGNVCTITNLQIVEVVNLHK